MSIQHGVSLNILNTKHIIYRDLDENFIFYDIYFINHAFSLVVRWFKHLYKGNKFQ